MRLEQSSPKTSKLTFLDLHGKQANLLRSVFLDFDDPSSMAGDAFDVQIQSYSPP